MFEETQPMTTVLERYRRTYRWTVRQH